MAQEPAPGSSSACLQQQLLLLLPPTDMLYMTFAGNWLTECSATVLDVQTLTTGNNDDDNKILQVVLDQTVLHAQGGGQPSDKGKLVVVCGGDAAAAVCIDIEKVTIDRATGVATHLATADNIVTAGQTVTVQLDTATRRILSECHTAGHVVDSAMELAGMAMKPSKAYHFLDGPYVEYVGSIAIPDRPAVLANLQAAFATLVDQDIATEIECMSQQDAHAVCNRQADNFDMNVFMDQRTQQVRVVTVAGYPCPCGGTHVRSTADLKERQWGITGLKSKKGVVRVKYGQNVDTTTKK